jgi:hypothetical protein
MKHHADRAMEELDLARSAKSMEAAIAHLDLSELHLGRMKAIGDSPAGPALRVVRTGEPLLET